MVKKATLVGSRKAPRIFPGWWLVVTGAFFNIWGVGYTIYGFSALFKPIAAELGFSRAAVSVAQSINRLEGGFAPLVGWLVDRFGPRYVLFVGIFLFSLGLMLMYFVNSLWAFYLVWGVIMGIGSSLGQGLPIQTAIANWFVKKRGLAFGIRMAVTGALLLPLVTLFVTTWGWRIACVIGGMGVLLIGFPLSWFSVKRYRPEYYGLLPDGASSQAELQKEDASQVIGRGVKYAEEVEEVEFTLRQAMKTPSYWLLIIAEIVPGSILTAVVVHFVPLLTDMGMSPTRAAVGVTLAGLSSIVSRFATGFVADRLQKRYLRFFVASGCLLQAVGIAIFLAHQTITTAFLLLVFFLVGFAINMVARMAMGGRYFGRKAFASIQGTMGATVMPFGMLFPPYFGWVYDTTGSYTKALATLAPLLILSAVIAILARPPKPPAVITDVRQIL